MRVLLLTPTALPAVTGNAVTVERWRRSLAARGVDVRVLAAEGRSPGEVAASVRRFSPDVLHAHHAFRAGAVLLEPEVEEASREAPLVVSSAGTDLTVDLGLPERAGVVRAVLARADALVAQGEDAAGRLEALLPEAPRRVVRIPKAVAWFGDDPFDLRAAAGCGPEHLLFFHPAGLRPVKGNLECLLGLEAVWQRRPLVRALFAGPVLDAEYAARFGREIERLRAFARWLPAIPPSAMHAAYCGADVVVNASAAEGLANAVLEAAAAGRPVLASDVPGNRGPVLGHGGAESYGCLYDRRDPGDFVRQALRLVDDAGLRRALGRGGRARAARWPSPEGEAEALARVYEAVLVSRT